MKKNQSPQSVGEKSGQRRLRSVSWVAKLRNRGNQIEKYLAENSAESSSSKRARKIIRSLNGQAPLRITETPYIREKHHELSSAIFSKPAIGSRSNCIACHTTAEQGDYDDDNVEIPV